MVYWWSGNDLFVAELHKNTFKMFNAKVATKRQQFQVDRQITDFPKSKIEVGWSAFTTKVNNNLVEIHCSVFVGDPALVCGRIGGRLLNLPIQPSGADYKWGQKKTTGNPRSKTKIIKSTDSEKHDEMKKKMTLLTGKPLVVFNP